MIFIVYNIQREKEKIILITQGKREREREERERRERDEREREREEREREKYLKSTRGTPLPEEKGKIREDVPPVDFMHLVFKHTPGDNYRRRLRSVLLYLCYV